MVQITNQHLVEWGPPPSISLLNLQCHNSVVNPSVVEPPFKTIKEAVASEAALLNLSQSLIQWVILLGPLEVRVWEVSNPKANNRNNLAKDLEWDSHKLIQIQHLGAITMISSVSSQTLVRNNNNSPSNSKIQILLMDSSD